MSKISHDLRTLHSQMRLGRDGRPEHDCSVVIQAALRIEQLERLLQSVERQLRMIEPFLGSGAGSAVATRNLRERIVAELSESDEPTA